MNSQENVSEVYELYLQDVDWNKKHREDIV